MPPPLFQNISRSLHANRWDVMTLYTMTFIWECNEFPHIVFHKTSSVNTVGPDEYLILYSHNSVKFEGYSKTILLKDGKKKYDTIVTVAVYGN